MQQGNLIYFPDHNSQNVVDIFEPDTQYISPIVNERQDDTLELPTQERVVFEITEIFWEYIDQFELSPRFKPSALVKDIIRDVMSPMKFYINDDGDIEIVELSNPQFRRSIMDGSINIHHIVQKSHFRMYEERRISAHQLKKRMIGIPDEWKDIILSVGPNILVNLALVDNVTHESLHQDNLDMSYINYHLIIATTILLEIGQQNSNTRGLISQTERNQQDSISNLFRTILLNERYSQTMWEIMPMLPVKHQSILNVLIESHFSKH